MAHSNQLHNLLDLDDTFDADESLLVSPAPRSTVGNVPNETVDDSFDIDVGIDSSFEQTPAKPKFSYASAMDALDDLVPSAMKTKRCATMFSLEYHSSAKKPAAERLSGGLLNESFDYSTLGDNDCSFVAETCGVGLAARLDEEGVDESLEASVDERRQSVGYEEGVGGESAACEVHRSMADENENSFESNEQHHSARFEDEPSTLEIDEEDESQSIIENELESCNESPPEINLDGIENNACYNDSNEFKMAGAAVEEGTTTANNKRSLAFRYPCIRQNNSEDGDLELKRGHPVNPSFDGSAPKRIDMMNASTTTDVENGGDSTCLDDQNRMDPIDASSAKQKSFLDISAEEATLDLAPTLNEFKQLPVENLVHECTEHVLRLPCADVNTPDNHSLENEIDESKSFAEEIGESNVPWQEQHETNSTDYLQGIDEAHLPAPMLDAVKYDTILNSPIDLNAEYPTINTSFEEENTPLPCLSALSGTLSQIAKSSSPHNCDDNLSNCDELVVLAKDAPPSSESEGADIVHECKTILSSAASEEVQTRGTIFDVLSQSSYNAVETKPDDEINQSGANEFVDEEQNSSQGISEVIVSSSKLASSFQPSMNNEDAGACGSTKSPDDLALFQDTFNSTSNALLQRLRASAETRKREVTRCRYSLERKEQVMLDEKDVRVSMPAVQEAEPTELPRRSSMTIKPKKKIEGLDPYKPFVARPSPATTVTKERPRRSSVSISAPKSATIHADARKKLAPHEDPYKPFKARPVPTTISQPTPLLGTKRKSSTALRPHPEQNHSTVKPSALKAKPPTRLLSGSDASTAKKLSLKERIEKENAKIRRESEFKALPLPSRTVTTSTSLIGEQLLGTAGKENVSSSRKRLSSIQPFTPHSGRRAEERAAFDTQRAEREKAAKIEQAKKRKAVLDKNAKDIDRLKSCIR